jgi:chitin disaccharide deacetylase
LKKHQTNRILGYPEDARLLIINADDFGMCNAVNEAIIRTLKEGVVQSTTLMVPCPWALNAMHYLGNHHDIPFGVHLTALCDGVDYRWGPVVSREKVPTLIDESGYFYNFDREAEFLALTSLDQLEMEFSAQIEVVLAAGLKPTHLDWHSLRISGRADIFEIMVSLAKKYGLALRVYGRSLIEKL